MTVRVYRSTDASAPSLTGQVGSLTALLDAVLVNGYGSQTAAGWTINQTGTNKRGYLQNLTGSNNSSGMLLYVDDTGPGAGAAKEARVCGFETMSAITPTGTGQFPTSAQSTIGVGTLVVRKSNTADATARPWTIVANGQTMMLFVETGDITSPVTVAYPFVFGDFTSYKSSDQYAVCIIGRQIENTNSPNNDHLQHVFPDSSSNYLLTSTMFGHYIARSWTGTGGSKPCGQCVDTGKLPITCSTTITNGIGSWNTSNSSTSANIAMGFQQPTVFFTYPNGPDSSIWLSPIWLNHDGSVRGHLRGLWAPMQHRPAGHNDTYTISGGNLNGKSMLAQMIPMVNRSGANDGAQAHVETSDTWS